MGRMWCRRGDHESFVAAAHRGRRPPAWAGARGCPGDEDHRRGRGRPQDRDAEGRRHEADERPRPGGPLRRPRARGGVLDGAAVLDLFAGSGPSGSRRRAAGARSVVLVESARGRPPPSHGATRRTLGLDVVLRGAGARACGTWPGGHRGSGGRRRRAARPGRTRSAAEGFAAVLTALDGGPLAPGALSWWWEREGTQRGSRAWPAGWIGRGAFAATAGDGAVVGHC